MNLTTMKYVIIIIIIIIIIIAVTTSLHFLLRTCFDEFKALVTHAACKGQLTRRT